MVRRRAAARALLQRCAAMRAARRVPHDPSGFFLIQVFDFFIFRTDGERGVDHTALSPQHTWRLSVNPPVRSPAAPGTGARAGVKVPESTFQHGRANAIFPARRAARGAPAAAGKWSSHFPWKDSVPMYIGNRNGGQTLRHLCVDKTKRTAVFYTQSKIDDIYILLFVSFLES